MPFSSEFGSSDETDRFDPDAGRSMWGGVFWTFFLGCLSLFWGITSLRDHRLQTGGGGRGGPVQVVTGPATTWYGVGFVILAAVLLGLAIWLLVTCCLKKGPK